MMFLFKHLPHLPSLLLFLLASTCKAQSQRQVWAWASWNINGDETIRQLHNTSWSQVIDGIQAACGLRFTENGLALNHTIWAGCALLFRATQETNTKFQMWVAGDVPQTAIDDPTPFIKDALDFAHRYPQIDGFSFDDESHCAPRSTVAQLEGWMDFHNSFAEELSDHGLQVTSAVQAMFGIQNEDDNNPCLFEPYGTNSKLPSEYDFVPRVPELMSQSSIQKWLIMDTYYYSTGHFLTTLDWHTQHISNSMSGIGISNLINNRDQWSIDELQARFYAIDRSGADWINIFIMPANEQFLPFLRRWKTFCRGCGKQPILGCYDFDVECRDDSGSPLAEL
jgi:hypothetical protein